MAKQVSKTKKNETSVMCPKCGTEFAIPEKQTTTVAVIIGKDSGIGAVFQEVAEKNVNFKVSKNAKERIEALREAGVDVSNLFAMQGANGGECIACNKDGQLSILDDNDPIFQHIINQGTISNRKLFRRWVMAQMFYMMSYTQYNSKEPVGVTEMIHRMGYEYQWKMMKNELYAQMKMFGWDLENFEDRNRWFNQDTAYALAKDYIEKLKKHVDNLPEKSCKGVPYKTVAGKNIFCSDLRVKLYSKYHMPLVHIKNAKTIDQLYNAVVAFNNKRIKLPFDTSQCNAWIDAYKGSGSYFTLQNMIRFHNCFIVDDDGMKLNKSMSLMFIKEKAKMYKDGDGWRMLAVLKKCLQDNNIDIKKKMAEWRKRK